MSVSVSVIIPTFNRASQVVEAVRSVLAQSVVPQEILVVDDGSTDNTKDALSPFSNSVRYIKKPNGGVSSARNLGILEAAGDWIAFLDSDDTWHPSKLERQLAAVTAHSAKVCFCVSVDESGTAIDDLNKMDPALAPGADRFYPRDDCRMFMHPGHPFLQSMLVEKSALMRCGFFDTSLRVAEDTKLIHGLILEYGYVVVNERYVNICRDREGPGLSDTMDPGSAYTRYDCYLRVQSEAYWRLLAIDESAAREVMQNLLYFASRLAELSCALGHPGRARRYAGLGLTVNNSFKAVLRSIFILVLYPIARWTFTRKWSPAPL